MQEDMPLQVALMASWHLTLARSNLQFLQQGLFLSLWREHRHDACVTQRFSDILSSFPCVSVYQVFYTIHYVFWMSYLHCAPCLNLQSNEQQRSSFRCRSPGSHSSPSSTLEFPHTLLFLSLKHTGALKLNVFPTEILLQLEKRLKKGKRSRQWLYTN